MRILEVGCGSGANLWYLSREGFDVYGTDHSQTGLQCARQLLARWDAEAKLALCDMTEIPFEGRFDAIVDIVSMQHLNKEDHMVCYDSIYKKLKPGGKFFSYHLGENSISYRHGGGKLLASGTVDDIFDVNMPLCGAGLTTFISVNDALEMVNAAGFKNIHIDKLNRTYNDQSQMIEYVIIEAEK